MLEDMIYHLLSLNLLIYAYLVFFNLFNWMLTTLLFIQLFKTINYIVMSSIIEINTGKAKYRFLYSRKL